MTKILMHNYPQFVDQAGAGLEKMQTDINTLVNYALGLEGGVLPLLIDIEKPNSEFSFQFALVKYEEKNSTQVVEYEFIGTAG